MVGLAGSAERVPGVVVFGDRDADGVNVLRGLGDHAWFGGNKLGWDIEVRRGVGGEVDEFVGPADDSGWSILCKRGEVVDSIDELTLERVGGCEDRGEVG